MDWILLLILIMVLLAGACWLFWNQKDQIKRLSDLIHGIENGLSKVETNLSEVDQALSGIGVQVQNVVDTTTLSWCFQTSNSDSEKKNREKIPRWKRKTSRSQMEQDTSKVRRSSYLSDSSPEGSPSDGGSPGFYQGLWMDPSGSDGPWTPLLNLDIGTIANPDVRFATTLGDDGTWIITFLSLSAKTFNLHISGAIYAPPEFYLPVSDLEIGFVSNPSIEDFYSMSSSNVVSPSTRLKVLIAKEITKWNATWTVSFSPGDTFTIAARAMNNFNVTSGVPKAALPAPVYGTDWQNAAFFAMPFFQVLMDDIV